MANKFKFQRRVPERTAAGIAILAESAGRHIRGIGLVLATDIVTGILERMERNAAAEEALASGAFARDFDPRELRAEPRITFR